MFPPALVGFLSLMPMLDGRPQMVPQSTMKTGRSSHMLIRAGLDQVPMIPAIITEALSLFIVIVDGYERYPPWHHGSDLTSGGWHGPQQLMFPETLIIPPSLALEYDHAHF